MKRALIGGGLLLSVALLASPAEAQIGFAKGRVVDAQGQPVADASVTAVYLGEMPKTSTRKTNKKGEYVHAGLYGGRYRITTEKEGYEPTIISMT
jgi:protocatechuate 3,4-dioxygenase beta subunit